MPKNNLMEIGKEYTSNVSGNTTRVTCVGYDTHKNEEVFCIVRYHKPRGKWKTEYKPVCGVVGKEKTMWTEVKEPVVVYKYAELHEKMSGLTHPPSWYNKEFHFTNVKAVFIDGVLDRVEVLKK